MPETLCIHLPENFDWKPWVTRWERMQERYLVKRNYRFSMIIDLIQSTQRSPGILVDLGCGPGSLTVQLLKAFPTATVIGIDMDPTLLLLAERRTATFGERIHLLQRDIRTADWMAKIPEPVNAVVSTTALHWLKKTQLRSLYPRIANLLADKGIFLNADHVRSPVRRIQRVWERHREGMRKQRADPRAEDWSTFINAYLAALDPEAATVREQMLGPWEGNDDGYPLAWHFDQMRKAGFVYVECFWRSDCDALYGGMVKKA